MKTKLLSSFPSLILAASLALSPGARAAASASDLLEKGIYTEETKGDVDAAIAIYQQLIGEAQNSQSFAAQAQFRLAQCYLKKNRTTDALATFEKLIRDFPQEKELVAKAREHLPADLVLEPVCWPDGERLKFILTLPAGMEIGAMETRADLVEVDGKKVWRVGRLMNGGGAMVSSVDVDATTFQPLTSFWKHTLLGEVSATFRNGEVEMQKAGSPDVTKVRPEKVVFDNEECFHLPRRLPLQVGYKATIPVITTLTGGAVLPLGWTVEKTETLEVPAGKFECFRIQLDIGQTMWFSTDANRYLVKFEAGGAIGQLAAIGQRKLGTPVLFRDDTLGVSFSAPADWLMHRFVGGKPEKSALIRTFDAGGDADDGGLRLYPTETLSTTARQSSRAWAESRLAEKKEVKVRADSWKNLMVAGRPAVSCIADYTDNDKPRVQFVVHALGLKQSEIFMISSAPEKFDALKAGFDTIVASYRTTK